MTAVLFTAAFAFLLASFPARNPDLWAHLAAGRDLAHGDRSGVMAYWTAEAKTVSGWLYNQMLFGLYSAVGGAGLVVIKAGLVAVTALVLLRVSRTRPGWLIPTFCTGLAVLALSPRALLQPVTVSYLFLAVTVWVLWRPGAADEAPPRVPWTLLGVFLLWVSTDRWFVVGLGVVALTWLGQALDGPAVGRVRFSRYAALGLAQMAALCLLNPAHVFAFGLAVRPVVADISSGGWLGASPFRSAGPDVLQRPPAELAYFALLALSLLSFAVALPRWRWGRALPWAGLAALSAVHDRAVPFFAVAAGPVLAWNLQDFFARRAAAPGGSGAVSRRGGLMARGFTGLLGLAFLACVWPGWLQAPPFGPRRWAIETAPALQRGGEAVARWHADGRIGPDGRGLHLSPETAFAFAWFCPEDQAVQDPVLAAGVLGGPDSGQARSRAAGVSHFIVYDTDRSRLSNALRRLFADPEQFPLLMWQGDLAVFGWRDRAAPTVTDPFRNLRPDFDRLALHPGLAEKAPPNRPAAEPRRWWEAFWKPAPRASIDSGEAVLHLLHADAVRRAAPDRHSLAWDSTQAAGMVGSVAAGGGPAGLVDLDLRFILLRPPEDLALRLHPAFARRRDDAPMAVLYLAIRSARRALAVNPDDPTALAALGEAYRQLLQETRERSWAGRLPQLAQLRRTQAVAALTRAVALNPDLPFSQLSLATLHLEMGAYDLALERWRAYLPVAEKHGPTAGAGGAEFRERAADLERGLSQLADTVAERERAYLRDAADLRVLDRAVRARDLGLHGRALDVLLQSDISAFGANGLDLELELLVRTGRVREVREWTDLEHQGALGPKYHWLRARALAASGDYTRAQDECRLLGAGDSPAGGDPRAVMAGLVAQAVLDGQTATGGPGWLLGRALPRANFRRQMAGLVIDLQRAADAAVLRGLIALEAGEVEEAEVALRLALDTWKDEAAAAAGGGVDFGARPVAQDCLKWFESGGRGR